MLKKMFKKALAVALTVATVVTASVPVGAAALKPKKSHSDSAVRARAEYLIEAADELAFSPWKKAPGYMEGTYEDRNDTHPYRAYKMCEVLLATRNLKSACSSRTIKELKKAKDTWWKAFCTNLMYLYYLKVWDEAYFVADNTWYTKHSVVSKKASSSYNRVKKYIEKYKKYNPEFAKYVASFNTKMYKGYKDYVKVLKGMTPAKIKKIEKRWGGFGFDTVVDTYKCFSKYGVTNDADTNALGMLETKISNWYWINRGMSPFNGDKNSSFNVFMRNTKYTAW